MLPPSLHSLECSSSVARAFLARARACFMAEYIPNLAHVQAQLKYRQCLDKTQHSFQKEALVSTYKYLISGTTVPLVLLWYWYIWVLQ